PIGAGAARGVLIVILVVEENLVLGLFPVALAEMLGELARHSGEAVLVVARKALFDGAGCECMAGNELLVFRESLRMLGDIPLVRSAQIAGPILKERQINNRHGHRGPGQIRKGRAREEWTVVGVPIPPAYDLGFGAFTS